MAHFRKPLALAAALNGVIVVGEAAFGIQANSLSLLMDSIHNLSDQLVLVFLYRHDEPRGSFDLPHHIRWARQGVSSQTLPIEPVWLKIGLPGGNDRKYDRELIKTP